LQIDVALIYCLLRYYSLLLLYMWLKHKLFACRHVWTNSGPLGKSITGP